MARLERSAVRAILAAMPSRWIPLARRCAGCIAWILMANAASAQQAVIRIGHVTPMSGWLARVGNDSANGARLAVETLNRQGVVLGGRRAVFELVLVDDAGDMARPAAAGRSLVEARVSGVVGHLLSDATMAGAGVATAVGGRFKTKSKLSAPPYRCSSVCKAWRDALRRQPMAGTG